MKSLVGAMGAAVTGMLCLGSALPAQASDITSVRQVDITVSGSIRQHCAIGSIGDMDFGNLERRGLARQTQVAFDCNVPFEMMIKGASGALRHSKMPNGQGPYGGAIPYSLSVELPLRFPNSRVVSKSFESRQIMSGATISSNGGIATDDMTLAVQLGRPSGEAGLLAGDYSETITITVTPL